MTFADWWAAHGYKLMGASVKAQHDLAYEAWEAATAIAERRAEDAAEQDWKYGRT